MSGIQNYWEFVDDFFGAGLFSASATAFDPWVVTDTSSSGTPTYVRVDLGETTGAFAPGVAKLTFDNTSEVQNVCLSFGNNLCFDINSLRGFETRIRLVPEGTLKDAATTMAWGVTGDRNDAIDSIAVASLFRLASGSAANAIVVESDDTVTNNDDVATGITLSDSTWTTCKIDFSNLADVKYYIGNSSGNLQRVASGTTFVMSSYAAGLQPFFQIQKTADTNTDSLEIDYVKLWGVR